MSNREIKGFIQSSKSVMDSFGITIEEGEVTLRTSPFSTDSILVVIGLTGDLHGQAILSMEQSTACYIASIMMGFEITQLGEETKSAIAELTNMIIGNSATLLSKFNIMLDITPPSVFTGENIQISTGANCFTVPLHINDGKIVEFTLSAKELS